MSESGSGKMERNQEGKMVSVKLLGDGFVSINNKANEDVLSEAMLMENREEAMVIKNRETAVPGEEEHEEDRKTKQKKIKKLK